MNEIIKDLIQSNDSKIVLCVLDGLGGIPRNGLTELQEANTPNLDRLAGRSECGMHLPVSCGITPGSGAAHMGLFGYDPFKNKIGRGVLEALGLGIELGPYDIAIRGNFATVEYRDGAPYVTDRRAGRITSDENRRVIEMLTYELERIGDARVSFHAGMEHRFVIVLTFDEKVKKGSDLVSDTDPQNTEKEPLKARGMNNDSQKVASVVNELLDRSAGLLRNERKANYILLRGFSAYPDIDSFKDIYGLSPACIAPYPMYRGVSRLVGMDILDTESGSIEDEIVALKNYYSKYDFFYMHIKKTDSCGEDGDFSGKAGVIEEFDSLLPEIISLSPDVLAVTGDHSTPALMKSHSWHSVPLLINSLNARYFKISGFCEEECVKGSLGTIKSTEIMPLLLAHAGRLGKYGA